MADDNRPLKYMRYAVGEIVLVVIGILIALQINNWNEDKKTQQRLREFLTEIQNDLSSDIIEANFLIDEYIAKDSIIRNIKYEVCAYQKVKLHMHRRIIAHKYSVLYYLHEGTPRVKFIVYQETMCTFDYE